MYYLFFLTDDHMGVSRDFGIVAAAKDASCYLCAPARNR